MAGHSKWANIKHKKERADAKKGKIISRCAKEIISAVKQGGSDPKTNTRLRIALQKARQANVSSDVIERNIKKASSADQADFSEMIYELYGHGGIGIVAFALTDNKNRTISEIRIATNKKGGSIASPGSVTFNFDLKGVIQIEKSQGDEEALFLTSTECGAEDFEESEEHYLVTTPPKLLFEVKEALESRGIETSDSTLEMIPKLYVSCDEETRLANEALITYLEALDDVDMVFHNMEEGS